MVNINVSSASLKKKKKKKKDRKKERRKERKKERKKKERKEKERKNLKSINNFSMPFGTPVVEHWLKCEITSMSPSREMKAFPLSLNEIKSQKQLLPATTNYSGVTFMMY